MPGYLGTVHFTSSDSQAVLPSNYTFVAADDGAHTFTTVVLKTAGSQSITATDTTTSSITGSAGSRSARPPPRNSPLASSPAAFRQAV